MSSNVITEPALDERLRTLAAQVRQEIATEQEGRAYHTRQVQRAELRLTELRARLKILELDLLALPTVTPAPAAPYYPAPTTPRRRERGER